MMQLLVRLVVLVSASLLTLSSIGQDHFFKPGTSFEKKMMLMEKAKQRERGVYAQEFIAFCDSVIAECEQIDPVLCTRAKVVRAKYYFNDLDLLHFVPLALDQLANDPNLTLKDSMLYYNWLSKSFEHSNVYVESLKYRTKIQTLLPRFLETYPVDYRYITNMSDFYSTQGKYRQALAAYKTNLKLLQERDGFIHLGTLTNSVGVCYNKIGEPDSAIKYFNEARALYQAYNGFDSAYINGLVDGNIGQAYMTKGEYAKAIPLLQNDIVGSLTFDKSNAFNSMVEITRCYLAVDDVPNAAAMLKDLQLLAKSLNMNSGQRLNLEMISAKVYTELAQYDLAQDHLYRYIEIQEEINTAEEIRQTNALLMVYDMKEKQKIIAEQKVVNDAAQKALDEEKFQQLLVWGVMVVIAVILVIVLLANKKVNDQKVALEDQIQITNEALLQKEVLLKEIHHRVKNNLQIMSGLMHLQASNTAHDWMKDYMKEGQQRIESMTLIHNMLYQSDQQLSLVDIGEYFNELINQLRHSFNIPNSIQITNSVAHLEVSLDIAVPMGLIINELITNSVKYAFPNGAGKIEIKLIGSASKTGYTLAYHDDGIGFDPEEVKTRNTLGVRLIRMFCEEMDAKLTVTSVEGVNYKFTFV